MHFERTVLDNGVTVISERMDSVRSVALGIWFSVGSRDELPAEGGISHFLEHMMFKGTPTRDARELSEAFDRLGAQQNAFTGKEATCYYAGCLDTSLAGVFELLGDMVTHAAFDQAACELERKVIIEEIARNEDDPEDVAHELYVKTLWPTHTLGLPIGGTRELVSGYGHDAAVAYRAKHYTTGRCVVAAAGNLEHAALVELARTHLADLPVSDGARGRQTPPPAAATRVFLPKESEQAHILTGTTTIPAGDERRFALTLLNTAFGGTMSSRLFQEIREKLGLVYAVYSMPQLYQGRGAFGVYAGTRPENAQHVAELIDEQVRLIARDGITSDELELARTAAKGSLALGLESTAKRMMRLAESQMRGEDPLSFDESLARLDAVTRSDVADMAAALGDSDWILSVVGPFAAGTNEDWSMQ
ncbi:MAG: insulinase family protein [Actinomycetes bacterium]|jgi:predicted Zn-dependent peptidase|nr:insulinase family protein [Actinomycetes bacterium]